MFISNPSCFHFQYLECSSRQAPQRPSKPSNHNLPRSPSAGHGSRSRSAYGRGLPVQLLLVRFHRNHHLGNDYLYLNGRHKHILQDVWETQGEGNLVDYFGTCLYDWTTILWNSPNFIGFFPWKQPRGDSQNAMCTLCSSGFQLHKICY